MGVVSLKGSLLLMAFLIHTVITAPVIEENTALLGPDQTAEGTGCYYNYEHYDEGDRILTNEPCLNCTCHNRMLMCYLRVCPFTKAIGQDCKVEKKPDQCCPVITCPQVPVALLTSSTTETTASTTTAVGHPDNYGCVLDDNVFYADGAQVPSDPKKPCELCYCIRNQTACVMQECTLNVEGCKPVYQEGVCCPVRYDCDYDEVLTTPRPTAGLVTTPGGPTECRANDRIFKDGEMIENMTENPCEHCYCMRGDIVCAVQECGTPLEDTECTPMPAEPGQCCPNTYQCPNGTVPAHVLQGSSIQKPSSVAPSLAQLKPEGVTESPVADKIVDASEVTQDAEDNSNTEEEVQEPEKTNVSVDSTVAESSEVITEAPKEQAVIEIITTAAPPEVAGEQTQPPTSESSQDHHPEVEQETPLVPEHDQVEEGHNEEQPSEEGHSDGQDVESHDIEATTASEHYTEISVENVEMNTSPPEVAKPEIPSASHMLDETESQSEHTDTPQEASTVVTSSQIKEESPLHENTEESNQQVEHVATGQAETQEDGGEPENPETTLAENMEATTKPQDTVIQPDDQESVKQPENEDAVGHSEMVDAESQTGNHDASIQGENELPDIETTMRPEIQEVINQLENEGAGSQQVAQHDHLEVSQPGNQEATQDASHQQEEVSTPTESAPSSQVPEEHQENEKLSAVSELPETTPAPVSSTITTEAEPEEMSRIPGEGSCLHRGITYAPNTEVPSTNACKRCRCVNSIVQCNDLECPEPPISLYSNCVPMPPTDDACCPTYFCEQKPSQEPEVDNMSIDKIDQGVEEQAPEEGIAPTTVASIHEDETAEPEHIFVPGTHEINEQLNAGVEEGSQSPLPASEDAEEVKPSGGEQQPDSVNSLGETSAQDVPSEGSHTASGEEQSVSIDQSSETPKPNAEEYAPADLATEPQPAIDLTTVPTEHQDTASEQNAEHPEVTNEGAQQVSQDNAESESDNVAETTPTPTITVEQENKLEEAHGSEPAAEEDQQPVSEIPQQNVFHDGAEDTTSEELDDIKKPVEEVPQDNEGGQDDAINDKIAETTPTPSEIESSETERVQEAGSHDDMTSHELLVENAVSTEAPSESNAVHETADHDSEASGSSLPIETEPIPTINQAENDLTATHDESVQEHLQESPTTALPDESSSAQAEYNEVTLPSTEGPSGASENAEVSEPMATSGPPVLFPDISHQGAPIHIPGPTGINTDGLSSEDERLGETEAPAQESSQTEQSPTHDESPSSNSQAAEVSESGIEDGNSFTTEGLSAVSQQTEGANNEIVSEAASEGDSGNNQITESSQTSEPSAVSEGAEEIMTSHQEPAQGSDDQSQVQDMQEPPLEVSTESNLPVTEVSQESVQPNQDDSELPVAAHDLTEATHDESGVQPTHDETEVQSTNDGSEVQPAQAESEDQTTHVESDVQAAHDESEAQPTHDETEAQPTHDETAAQLTHEESEPTEELVTPAAEHHVETEAPLISEKEDIEVVSTEAPLAPIVTHGDLPTPSQPENENVVHPSGETEEKLPESPETQQVQDGQSSASQSTEGSNDPEVTETSSENAHEVTQAPENDEVVTHIDSAGPQQVPEIANQVVETDSNVIEHATGDGHKEEDAVSHPIEEHHEPTEQEQPSAVDETQSSSDDKTSDSVVENQEHPDAATVEHHDDTPAASVDHSEAAQTEPSEVAPPEHSETASVENQEQSESEPVETSEESHIDPLSGAHDLQETSEQHEEQPTTLTPSEGSETEGQQPQEVPSDHVESSATGETLPETSPDQEGTVPDTTHDEIQPETSAAVEDHEETQDSDTDTDKGTQSEVTEGQPHSTLASQEQEVSQDVEVQPEHQNVVEEEVKPFIQNLEDQVGQTAEDVQETSTQQESGSGQPITDEQVSQAGEISQQVPLAAQDTAPSTADGEQAQTDKPAEGEISQHEDVTATPEHSELTVDNQKPTADLEKDEQSVQTTPAVQQEDTSEKLASPDIQPSGGITQAPDSAQSASDSPIQIPEEVPVENAPSGPETAPSAPGEVSAPEELVPEVSAPELVAPDQPSAPEYTAPEQPSAPESEVQPSAPEEPIAPEIQTPSGQDEVPQESGVPSQPDQSSHKVDEIEKEQSVPETSSSPIAELPQSSPLPPVEMPSTEGPVLPPSLQSWSQKPYHPPSIPEQQQHHHTTAEVPHLPEDSHYPSQPYDQDYEDDDNVSYGPGTCRYGGKVYLSAQQIPRDDPCDFCFCFRSDIICLQQSCPPPIRGCYQETIKGFCCPRYECHVSMATMVNITTTSTTTTTTVPPHFLSHHYNGSAMKAGCQVKGIAYKVGDRIPSTSGPCLDCRCGADGQMKCDPTVCGPQESLLRQVMAASVSKRRRR